MKLLVLEGLVKLMLVLIFSTTALIITTRDLLSLFRSYAWQSLFIAAVALFLFLQEQHAVLLYTAGLTLLSKTIFIPRLLKHTQKSINIHRDVEFHYLQPAGSIFLSVFIIFLVYLVFSKLLAAFTLFNSNPFFSVGAVLGLSLALIGMTIIFSRKQIVSKMMGYLVMENGVVLFSLFLGELPFLIESLVLMDLIMLIMLSAVLGFGMSSSVEDFHAKLNPFRNWLKRGRI